MPNRKKYDVAAYIWPSCHYEPRLEHFWPEKDGEWYTVRRGTPRFEGHDMPKIPLLGYQDDADPDVMRQQVALGAKYGVNTFIMDWYWYDNAPCLERQLNEGLIPALEGSKSKFYLMWANHHATTVWNMHTDVDEMLWSGKVNRDVFEGMMDRVIDKYFKLDSYYQIDGKPVFSIYYAAGFVAGLGSVKEAQSALDWLQLRAKEKGLPGVHLQLTVRRGSAGAYEDKSSNLGDYSNEDLVSLLGAHSGTSYQFVADAEYGEGDYVPWANAAMAKWEEDEKVYPMFFPHVTIGWDNTQRMPSEKTAIINSTPFAFEACLHKAKMFIDNHTDRPQLITINSWNEWTEGSYLLPDMRWGYAYLEAVKKVFVD